MCCVAYCFDRNVILPALVSVGSLLRTARLDRLDAVYLVHDGKLAEEDRKLIDGFINRWGQKDWIRVIEYDLSNREIKTLSHPHITRATLLRLVLPECIDKAHEKILYVDIDTIFRDDATRLLEVDLGNKTIGAVRDYAYPFLGSANRLDYCQDAFELDLRKPYFNSGLLLINREAFIREAICERTIGFFDRYFEEMQKRAHLYDQDALNAICSRSWKELPARWNTPWETSWKSYPPEPDGSGVKHASMIHFMGSRKPWNVGLKSARVYYYHCQIIRSKALSWRRFLWWEINYIKSNISRLFKG